MISSAVGLIQFMKKTIAELNAEYGTNLTKEDYEKMTVEQQLEWVWKYFKLRMGQFKVLSLPTLEDVYMLIHWPAAVGKPLTQTMYVEGSREYLANRGLDVNKDGVITKAEAGGLIRTYLGEGLRAENYG